ncbi:hypothetical protein EKO27_g6370 [Xylaria grammica]|uniref:Aromatic prenyltransferase n=1 Tax=Xylaria grammica TaxID=363999 RepID=A0A439D2Y6_9PEZI|nr:hypothetical protein EKO27_g6370 [Xylaria grammica]
MTPPSEPNSVNPAMDLSKTGSLVYQVTQEVQSGIADQAFWWGALAHPLATLLRTSQYSQLDQLYYLRWFHKWVTPALGPRPIDGKPHYGAWLTYDGSCLEYSLNWKEKKPGQTVRFTIEPSSKDAGTAADPLKQLAAREFLTAMAKDVPGIDMKRFDLFHSEICVPDDRANEVQIKNPVGGPLTLVWVAFDLERGRIVAKAYFLPHMKAVLTGIPTKTIVFDAIRKCNGLGGSYDGSITALNDYLESFPLDKAPQVVLLSNDCVADSPACRNKVYVHASVGTLAHAKSMFHLGGRLSGETIAAGLRSVHDLWCHLFNLDSTDPDSENVVALADGRLFLCVYEMRPTKGGDVSGGVDMEVKLHIPGWRLGKSDTEMSEMMRSWFRSHGDREFAARYEPDLASAL